MANSCIDDRDCIIRTVLSEGGANASPAERAAITHVIMNRLHAGSSSGYADSVPGVLFQKNAFEPWGLRRDNQNHPMRWDASSPAYADAAKTVDGVLSGSIPDPTNGADRFQQPETVAARIQQGKVSKGVQLAPKNAVRIGQQSFWASPQTQAKGSVSPSEYGHLIKKSGPAQVAGEDTAPTEEAGMPPEEYGHLITGKSATEEAEPPPKSFAETVQQGREQGGIPGAFQAGGQRLAQEYPTAATAIGTAAQWPLVALGGLGLRGGGMLTSAFPKTASAIGTGAAVAAGNAGLSKPYEMLMHLLHLGGE